MDTLIEKQAFPEGSVQVLDKGYVRLLAAYGSDLDVANAARASFQKESIELSQSDARLIQFLAKHGHWSCFRHCFVSLEIKAPLEVCRQWWKYVTASVHTDSFSTSWNEASRRYITMEPEFYIPNKYEWRSAPANKKQGSGGPLGPFEGAWLTSALNDYVEAGMELYQAALKMEVAPEVARLFLPAYGMYQTWRWSTSLQAIAFFLNQRLEEGAQSEIRDYAKVVLQLIEPKFPISIGSLVGDALNG